MQLQRQRVQLEGAGAKIEALAESVPARRRASIWAEAAEVYRALGDTPAELRALDKLASMSNGGSQDPRYYQLLLAARPQDLIQRAAGHSGSQRASADSVTQYLLANGKPDLALAGIAARSAGLPPVWKKAYTGLAGLYLREHTPQVRQSFDSALGGDATIGERVAHPVDRNEQLAGEVWFYYGSRYGEYLDEEKDAQAESYLEAELEHTPESAQAYAQLADYSAQADRAEAALADYRHSLDLQERSARGSRQHRRTPMEARPTRGGAGHLAVGCQATGGGDGCAPRSRNLLGRFRPGAGRCLRAWAVCGH